MRCAMLIIALVLLPLNQMLAQEERHVESIAAAVFLDSVVVVAEKSGFDVADFIELVRTDQTFYRAFKNLRSSNYKFNCEMEFYDKKGRQKATYWGKHQQYFREDCRYLETLEESHTGNFYKSRKNKHKYYTGRLYEYLFAERDTICGESHELSTEQSEDLKGMAKHKAELKKLIFNPGQKSDVAFIGKKTELFDPDLLKYYNLSIESGNYNTIPCYIFNATLKPEYRERKFNKTVIKELKTFFEKGNLQVLARDYRLAHRKALYQFDVTMHIELITAGSRYVPGKITYDGFWDIPAKTQETGTFTLNFWDFQ